MCVCVCVYKNSKFKYAKLRKPKVIRGGIIWMNNNYYRIATRG